jgi:hypothetical protein
MPQVRVWENGGFTMLWPIPKVKIDVSLIPSSTQKNAFIFLGEKFGSQQMSGKRKRAQAHVPSFVLPYLIFSACQSLVLTCQPL